MTCDFFYMLTFLFKSTGLYCFSGHMITIYPGDEYEDVTQ